MAHTFGLTIVPSNACARHFADSLTASTSSTSSRQMMNALRMSASLNRIHCKYANSGKNWPHNRLLVTVKLYRFTVIRQLYGTRRLGLAIMEIRTLLFRVFHDPSGHCSEQRVNCLRVPRLVQFQHFLVLLLAHLNKKWIDTKMFRVTFIFSMAAFLSAVGIVQNASRFRTK